MRVESAEVRFHARDLVTPLVLPSGAIAQAIEAEARVAIVDGSRKAVGRGCIYLSDLWAWHDTPVPHDKRERRMQLLCEHVARVLPGLVGEVVHPIEAGLMLHQQVVDGDGFARRAMADAVVGDVTNDDVPPALARAVCVSPFDAALHDAVGRACGRSALDLYEDDTPLPLADAYLDGDAATQLRTLLDRPPRTVLPAWWIVNRGDDLNATVARAVAAHGYRCFKFKTTGIDVDFDVRRTADVYHAARQAGARDIELVVDSNEATAHLDDVARFLAELERHDADAFAALRYMEQPTARDIAKHAYDWRSVGRVKPVMLDEGLTSLHLLPAAREQGWTGLALKTCKGHSAMLVAAAWAFARDMPIAVQDLTNPGYAAIHAALAASRMPSINGVELNSLQFTPDANRAAQAAVPGLFGVHDGAHRLPESPPIGLGSAWLDGDA